MILENHSVKLSILVVLIMVFCLGAGCSSVSNKNNTIAYISSNVESDYKKTFEELNLGIIFDFNLRLPNADKSWVKIWLEGYSDGMLAQPFPLPGPSFGLFPGKVAEGNTGFGIINPNGDNMQFLFYSQGGISIIEPNLIDGFFIKNGISVWDYAIDRKEVELEPGEEKTLAVYRQSEGEMRTYDYQDLESINKMIKEDKTVLLLKVVMPVTIIGIYRPFRRR